MVAVSPVARRAAEQGITWTVLDPVRLRLWFEARAAHANPAKGTRRIAGNKRKPADISRDD
jgi:hypothetical protein